MWLALAVSSGWKRPILSAAAVTILLQGAAIYLPAGQALLKTSPLSVRELALCVTASTAVVWIISLEKLFRVSVDSGG
jgi:hypothetical protein